MFERVDRNGDGQVSRSELIRALRQDEALQALLGLPAKIGDDQRSGFEVVFQGMDKNDNRSITLPEFAAFLRCHNTASTFSFAGLDGRLAAVEEQVQAHHSEIVAAVEAAGNAASTRSQRLVLIEQQQKQWQNEFETVKQQQQQQQQQQVASTACDDDSAALQQRWLQDIDAALQRKMSEESSATFGSTVESAVESVVTQVVTEVLHDTEMSALCARLLLVEEALKRKPPQRAPATSTATQEASSEEESLSLIESSLAPKDFQRRVPHLAPRLSPTGRHQLLDIESVGSGLISANTSFGMSPVKHLQSHSTREHIGNVMQSTRPQTAQPDTRPELEPEPEPETPPELKESASVAELEPEPEMEKEATATARATPTAVAAKPAPPKPGLPQTGPPPKKKSGVGADPTAAAKPGPPPRSLLAKPAQTAVPARDAEPPSDSEDSADEGFVVAASLTREKQRAAERGPRRRRAATLIQARQRGIPLAYCMAGRYQPERQRT